MRISNTMVLSSCLLFIPMILAVRVERHNYLVTLTANLRTLRGVNFIEVPSEYLNVSFLYLHEIRDKAFENVTNIKILDLSYNSFCSLSENTFAALRNLEQLNLSNNKLSRLEKPFVGLSSLKVLDLSNTMIETLKSSNFFGLTESCSILLERTNIAKLSTTVFKDKLPPPGYFDQDNNHDSTRNNKDSRNRIRICINGTKLISVEPYTEGEQLASGCNTDRSYAHGVLNLAVLHIAEFQKSWYKLGDSPINHINLSSNRITRLTNEMLNDLPESISIVDLSSNNIKRLENGTIVNEHLREINFSFGSIIEIEDGVFINTNLETLVLSYNQLMATKFAATLPSTLTKIELNRNRIAEIFHESFAKMNKLEVLLLNNNCITEIHRDNLRGLSSLKYLNLENNNLQKIDAGTFKYITALEVLHLKSNYITELELSVFADLKNIKRLGLSSNGLSKITRDSSIDLPDSLDVLNLQENDLNHLKAGIFVNFPKYELLLKKNNILKIEDGVFHLPDLRFLQLGDNLLTSVDSGKFQGLKNLQELRLDGNKITRIEKGAFKHLGSLCHLNLSKNPIKTLENGTLQGLLQEEGCYVRLKGVPTEIIHGGVFTSSVESHLIVSPTAIAHCLKC